MESLSHFVHSLREGIITAFSLVSFFDFLIFLCCFLVFVLIYFLACMLVNARFFISQILKTIALMILLATPVVLLYVNQNILYKTKVEYKMAKRLEFSPTFFLDATLKNIGRKEIAKCYFVLKVLRESKSYKSRILNHILPLKVYQYPIQNFIPRGGSLDYSKTINDFPYQTYQYSISCYGGK